MKNLSFSAIAFLIIAWFCQNGYSHPGHSHSDYRPPVWYFANGNSMEASFLFHRGDSIFFETINHEIASYSLDDFSPTSKSILSEKIDKIDKINDLSENTKQTNAPKSDINWYIIFSIFLSVALIGIVLLRLNSGKKWAQFIMGAILALTIGMAITSFRSNSIFVVNASDPEEVDKAFEPFKPKVNTFWNDIYFYVESQGIPDHEMMTGITKWQQQVPIPQCYVGANAWPIPLKPELAAVPVPVNQEHFLRGAIAVAANGVPIFNPFTNTGIDALVDGQLDKFGGHSGRADDYHYHIAPMHLDTITEGVLPIAYALDGFAIYGPFEPDGSPMKPLDDNHGHFGSDGIYHYHGTKEKPYMIGKMVGKVTEDNTMQIVPQAAAKGVRPALTPLNGATITACVPNSSQNGYNLTYVRNNETYMVNYSWTNAGKYTYNFVSPSGTTTSVYNGLGPCTITSGTDENQEFYTDITLVPNPAMGDCSVIGLNDSLIRTLKRITILDRHGNKVREKTSGLPHFSVTNLPAGIYFVHFDFTNNQITKKIIVQ